MKGKMRRGCGGPCNHCGRTCSPCWRKGPPGKPVLCNACGARYLVKRNLDGYMPGQKMAGGVREATPGYGGLRSDRESTRSSSDRSTSDRRIISSTSLSQTTTVREQRRRKPQNSFREMDDSAFCDLNHETMDYEEVHSFGHGRFGIGLGSKFNDHSHVSNEEYLDNLAHAAAYTLAMLRCSSLHSQTAKWQAVKRGVVSKPSPRRARMVRTMADWLVTYPRLFSIKPGAGRADL